MAPIPQFSQFDLSKSYTSAGYLTGKFDEFVELIKGRVMRPMAGQSRMHQCYSMRISAALYQHIKKGTHEVFTAPFDVRLTTGGANGDQQIQTVGQPDICVVCDPAKLDDRGCVGRPTGLLKSYRLATPPATPLSSLTCMRKAGFANTR